MYKLSSFKCIHIHTHTMVFKESRMWYETCAVCTSILNKCTIDMLSDIAHYYGICDLSKCVHTVCVNIALEMISAVHLQLHRICLCLHIFTSHY